MVHRDRKEFKGPQDHRVRREVRVRRVLPDQREIRDRQDPRGQQEKLARPEPRDQKVTLAHKVPKETLAQLARKVQRVTLAQPAQQVQLAHKARKEIQESRVAQGRLAHRALPAPEAVFLMLTVTTIPRQVQQPVRSQGQLMAAKPFCSTTSTTVELVAWRAPRTILRIQRAAALNVTAIVIRDSLTVIGTSRAMAAKSI